jgi:hypothetical protein
MASSRVIRATYRDPLEVVWLRTAGLLGMRVERSPEVFASWDGAGALLIGTPETLDPDDSLAQMIFHEVCHALVEGPEKFKVPDWGLDIDQPDHLVHEQACLRVQAKLADEFELRQFFAATTDFRLYYDELGADPLKPLDDPAVKLSLEGWRRGIEGPWSGPLRKALRATSEILQIAARFAENGSLWRSGGPVVNGVDCNGSPEN